MSADEFSRAAEAIQKAKTLIVTAGAGMGVDSGLPDFRGDSGFWNAYPMYERLGINFVAAANPAHFQRDPAFGWGFYGHRTNLYRDTTPHAGFALLLKWIIALDLDCFVVTSNVDGHFQKAGFDDDAILEVHGSIHNLQCLRPCTGAIWPNGEAISVNLETMRADDVPRCIACGGVARPNILMFGDFSWLSERTEAQEQAFSDFLSSNSARDTVVIEMGAGTAIPTIRATSERLGRQGAAVIRINPREPHIHSPHISIAKGAMAALTAIDAEIFGA